MQIDGCLCVFCVIILYCMDAALYGRGHGNNKRRRLRDRSPSQSPSYSRRRRRRRRRDARRAVNVVRVRARCVGVGLVYRAPVAAATKAARAGGYAVPGVADAHRRRGDERRFFCVQGWREEKARVASTGPAFSLVLVERRVRVYNNINVI